MFVMKRQQVFVKTPDYTVPTKMYAGCDEDPDDQQQEKEELCDDPTEIELLTFGWIRFVLDIYIPTVIKSLCVQYCEAYFVSTNIIDRTQSTKLYNILNKKDVFKYYNSSKRVYSGILNGFTSTTLYTKMKQLNNNYNDHLPPTILIIQSNYGNIFGVYQSIPWKMDSMQSDERALIFSLDENKAFVTNGSWYSVCYPKSHNDGYLVFYGSPAAIYLGQNCNLPTNCCGYGSYNIPKGVNLCGGTNHDEMSQTYKFSVANFEIHQLQRR